MRLLLISLLTIVLCPAPARAEWQRSDTSLAWLQEGRIVWRFSFDQQAGKPFFDPLTIGGGPSLTKAQPADHAWHYGVWFSWKFINGANYWEESRETGKAEGATRWKVTAIETRPDGSAEIRLDVSYTHPSGRVDVTEQRELRVSVPAADGGYHIDWHARFTAGAEGALFERTPMPGEPDGRVNGGYAGLGVRLAGPPEKLSLVSVEGPVDDFPGDRARPSSAAVAFNMSLEGQPLGGVAVFSDPANSGEKAPWYVARSRQMHFACAAVLAPKPITLAPGATWELRYRIAVRPGAWTPEALKAALR